MPRLPHCLWRWAGQPWRRLMCLPPTLAGVAREVVVEPCLGYSEVAGGVVEPCLGYLAEAGGELANSGKLMCMALKLDTIVREGVSYPSVGYLRVFGRPTEGARRAC